VSITGLQFVSSSFVTHFVVYRFIVRRHITILSFIVVRKHHNIVSPSSVDVSAGGVWTSADARAIRHVCRRRSNGERLQIRTAGRFDVRFDRWIIVYFCCVVTVGRVHVEFSQSTHAVQLVVFALCFVVSSPNYVQTFLLSIQTNEKAEYAFEESEVCQQSCVSFKCSNLPIETDAKVGGVVINDVPSVRIDSQVRRGLN
jgi:hypothetical protein